MKLEEIEREHLIQAGYKIDQDGIPKNNLVNNYWVKFPNGREYPFKHLTRIAYQLLPGNEGETLKFQSNESYRNYIASKGFQFNYYEQGIPFFSLDDINHFKKNAGKKYRKSNPDNILDSKHLHPLVKKLNVWAANSIIDDFQYKKDHGWQWSGTFKDYLWIRVYRQDSSKKVFFVLVVTQEGLLYKIDCLRSNHTQGTSQALDKEKIIAFDNYLKRPEVNYKEGFIYCQDLASYNWNSLLEMTRQFISNYSATFDDLERIVLEENKQGQLLGNLTLGKAPEFIRSKISKKRNYKGKNIDWGKRQIASSKLGMEGEQLVIGFEKKKLRSVGLNEKADEVGKMLDGNGYDVRSFDLNGDEIHIEVKTTTGTIGEPFYISINEKCFPEDYPANYFLYRLYNYNFNSKSAEFYILDANDFNKLDFVPINYEVSIQGKK